MSNLSAFLHPVPVEEQEVVISNRFKNEDGTVAKFRIRAITQEENDALVKKCTVYTKRNGQNERSFDATKFARAMVVAATVYPDFTDTDLCAAYGVVDPTMVAPKMLLAGEYQKLADAIASLSGISGNEIEEEAKN